MKGFLVSFENPSWANSDKQAEGLRQGALPDRAGSEARQVGQTHTRGQQSGR